MNHSRYMACATILVSLMSCTSTKKKEVPVAESKLSPAEQQQVQEFREEVEVGRNMAGRLLQFYGSYGDTDLLNYVNKVANFVADYSDFPERRYMVGILDTEMVNAFACPGGYMFITMGTLREAKSEAELAAILGHEVAHVGKKHMFTALKSMKEKEMEKLADENEKKEKSKKIEENATRSRPEPEVKSEMAAMIARYAGGSAGASFGLLAAAKAGMNLILEKGLDKKYEYEADHEGVKYAVRAGYEPNAMVDFLDRLGQKKKAVNTAVLDKTHPKVDNRKRRIVKLLEEMKASEIIGADGKERFKTFQDDLPKKKKT